MSAPRFSNTNYFLASRLRNDILEDVNVNHIYEKICLIHNHRSNRRRVCGFLHATTGDNWNFDHGGDSRLAVAITGTKEEDHHQEEGPHRSVAFACGRIRIAFADTLKSVGARS